MRKYAIVRTRLFLNKLLERVQIWIAPKDADAKAYHISIRTKLLI